LAHETPSRPSAGVARGSDEFARVLTFSDGMFAIAMTLLVVGIEVPELADATDEGELLDALNDLKSQILSFFISFAVIGRYWVAHHRFFTLLGSLDYRLVWINLVYLACVAFLPFPTALLGNYFENPISVAIYAVTVALVSGLEVVLFRHSHRAGLLRREMPEPVYRWGRTASSLPVLFMLLSVPIAFLNTVVAVLMWFGGVPAQMLILDPRKPAGADDYL
jgi:TMEM175 potassium channel family protein